MKIYKLTDRLKVKINDVEVALAPLTYAQKSEIQSYMMKAAKGDIDAGMAGARLAISYSLKDVKGIENCDGSEYKLDMENNVISNDCMEELLNSEMSNELTLIAVQMLVGIPKVFVNPNDGKELVGVQIVNPKKAKTAKKKK